VGREPWLASTGYTISLFWPDSCCIVSTYGRLTAECAEQARSAYLRGLSEGPVCGLCSPQRGCVCQKRDFNIEWQKRLSILALPETCLDCDRSDDVTTPAILPLDDEMWHWYDTIKASRPSPLVAPPPQSCLPSPRSSCRLGSSRRTDTTYTSLTSTPCWPSRTKGGGPAASNVPSDQCRAASIKARRTRSTGKFPSSRCPLRTIVI
jgi:hypothetical protein